MNDHDAPTNFMVCIEKRRAYTLRRTELFISANETYARSAAKISSTKFIFCRNIDGSFSQTKTTLSIAQICGWIDIFTI